MQTLSPWRAIGRAVMRFHRDERGQAMVEAAIILPIFVTTIAMTLEMCVLSTVKSVVNYGAYAACRAGIVHNADSKWMVYAAAMAISPVTQSSFVNTKMFSTGDDLLGISGYPTYGTWEWEGDLDRREAGDGKAAVTYEGQSYKAAGAGARGLARTGNFLVGTGVAILQFSQAFSIAEYVMLSDIEGLLGDVTAIGDMIGNLDSLDDIEAIINQVNLITATIGAIDTTPINRLLVIKADPADSEDVAAQTGTLLKPLEWESHDVAVLGSTTDDLLTETGAKQTGISFLDVRSGRNKSLRLHIRLIHRHALIFPFLKVVYRNVIERRAEQGITMDDDETKIVGLANLYGMVEIWGDCVMQMQSNLTLLDE